MLAFPSRQQIKDCYICRNECVPDDVTCKLPCDHVFHRACLVPWLVKSRRCPTCFKSLSEKEYHQIVNIKQRVIWGLEAVKRVFISKENLFMQVGLTMLWLFNSSNLSLAQQTRSNLSARQIELASSFVGRAIIYILSGFFSGAGFRGAQCGKVLFFSAGFLLGIVLLKPLFSVFEGSMSSYTILAMPLLFMIALAAGYDLADKKY